MGYVLLMTFAGSALFIGYLCCEKILGQSMTQCIKYRALTVVMLIYAVPWVWVKGIYRNVIVLFWPGEVAAGSKLLVDMADIQTKETAYRTKEYQILTLVVSIWFAIAVMLLLIRIVKALRRTFALRTLAIRCEDKNLEETMKCLNETFHYRHRPEFVWTRVDNETFTIGTIKPIVFLQKDYADGDLYWILKHEIMHIARMDLWVKLLLEFICCLHWFNPLIYLLERKIKYLCETSCDERVLKGCTEKEKQIYMDLLHRNKAVKKQKMSVGRALESNSKEIDERIALIKNAKDIGLKEKTIVICVFGVMIFLDSLTALAYPDVHHVKNAVMDMAEDAVDGGNFWTYDYVGDGFDAPIEIILYDEQFVDEKNEVYPIIPEVESPCLEHDFTSGIIWIHARDEDGGCVVKRYEGVRCIMCGEVQRGKFLYRVKKFPCPH